MSGGDMEDVSSDLDRVSPLLLKIGESGVGTGSRDGARELRAMVERAIDLERRGVVLDFEDASSCSSGFLDELVGKLVEKYGVLGYSRHVSVRHVSGATERLVNHSVSRRLAGAQCVG